MPRGLIHVYTGTGKGKTTSSLGLALRALGHGWKVYMVQFMKSTGSYGEMSMAKTLPGFTLIQSGLPTWVKRGQPSQDDLKVAREGYEKAKRALASGEYQLVILDEINVAVDHGLFTVEEVIDLIQGKADSVELVLTGRYAHEKILQLADYVTEVKMVKHPFQKGISAREGIEY
jgi:cob(I)alamin adenosyltransferase